MFRFSLRALVCLTAVVAIGLAVFVCSNAESEVERDIRLYGDRPITDRETLFAKVEQLIDARQSEGRWHDPEVEAVPEPVPRPTLTRVEFAQIATHYRKAYPLVSLRERLAYERARKHRHAKLLDSTLERMNVAEDPTHGGMTKGEWPQIRTHALQQLHSRWVFHFIRQEGAGVARLPPDPSVRDLEVEPWPEIMFEATTHQPPGEPVDVPDTEPNDPSARVFERWTEAKNPMRVPSRPRLESYFQSNLLEFTQSGRNGFAKDVDHVAGFLPHRLMTQSNIRMGAPRFPRGLETPVFASDWGVKTLQLVSLLKHDRPKVYVSKTLPNMESLPEANVRDLDGFESRALERLYNGEDLCIEGRQNQVRMLGSLRAIEQCRDCHFVKRGQLLGAFSYEFARLAPNSFSSPE
ncbi:MAG: hypothetical protein AAFX06_32545 [Planctomycetota bacterium]